MTWPTKKLGEVCEIFNGVSVPKKQMKSSGRFKIIKNRDYSSGEVFWGNDENGWTDREVSSGKFIKVGDSILINAAHNKSHVASKIGYVEEIKHEQTVTSGEVMIIRAKEGATLPRFVHFLLKEKDFIEKLKAKVNGIHLYPKDVAEIEILLPPLEVQKKIVAKLESVLAKINEAKKLRAEARENADSLLSAELHKIFEEGKKKGWEEKELGDLFDITSSKRVFKSEWTDHGVPFYRARELVSLSKNKPFKNPIYISEQLYETYKNKYDAPKEGDILATGVGTLGVSYLVKGNDRFYFKDGNIIWLKKKTDTDSKLIEYFFESPTLKEQIEETAAGATVRTFTIQTAKKIKISLPPLAEQKKIVVRLDAISQKVGAVKELQNQTENEFSALESSVLSKAFPGELV